MLTIPTGITNTVRTTDLNSIVDSINGNGVHNGMTCSANGSGLGVNVAAGAYTANGTKVQYAGATPAVTLDAADATNPRYDIITADSSGVIAIVKGTANAVPQYPVIPAGKIRLAIFYVHPNTTTLLSFHISDARIMVLTSVGSATIAISTNSIVVNDRAIKTNSKVLISFRSNPTWSASHVHSILVHNMDSTPSPWATVNTAPALAAGGSPTGISGIIALGSSSQYSWVDTIVDSTSFKINTAANVGASTTVDYLIIG